MSRERAGEESDRGTIVLAENSTTAKGHERSESTVMKIVGHSISISGPEHKGSSRLGVELMYSSEWHIRPLLEMRRHQCITSFNPKSFIIEQSSHRYHITILTRPCYPTQSPPKNAHRNKYQIAAKLFKSLSTKKKDLCKS